LRDEPNPAQAVSALRPFPWASLLWFSLLLAALYAPVLAAMVREWAIQEEMGHGFFVPLVVGYIVWCKRAELLAIPTRADWRGTVLVLWGFAQLWLGTAAADFFLARTAFIVSLLGVIWTLGGLKLLRSLAFPLLLLLFMIRIPQFIYSQITFPLQLLASRIAAVWLGLLSIPVLREGNILELASQRLSVVEACSGIRSLLSLSFLALVYGYFFDRKLWIRCALLLATVPIAIFTNAFRVTLTGVLSEFDPSLTLGFFHQLEGWGMFLIALAALVAVHRILNGIYSFAHGRRLKARLP
jgi:exosortase